MEKHTRTIISVITEVCDIRDRRLKSRVHNKFIVCLFAFFGQACGNGVKYSVCRGTFRNLMSNNFHTGMSFTTVTHC